jgi:AAA+ ATPase superfamily predicted ATPase
MRFFNRADELERLADIGQRALSRSQMTIIMGRRRIGKTRLIRQFIEKIPSLYFFVSRKSDELLAEEFMAEIQHNLNIPIYGQIRSSKDMIKMLLEFAQTHPITIVFDEFQNYQYVNPSIFSDLQNLWDQYKEKSKCHLIIMGSVNTLMEKIFQNQREPLFGRSDHHMTIQPFTLPVVAQILKEHKIHTSDALLDYMIFSGGIPRYLEWICGANKANYFDFLKDMFYKDSPIIHEGKIALIDEFGRNYSNYFTILQLLASGRTNRSDLHGSFQSNKELGGFLKNLQENFGLIQKVHPVTVKEKKKILAYKLKDYFYSFWFRFIYKNQSAIEAENYMYLLEKLKEEWPAFKGIQFENVIRDYLKTLSIFDQIGSYWDRKGENEIDIVAVDSIHKRLLIGDCKLNLKKVKPNLIKERSAFLTNDYHDYQIFYSVFTPDRIFELLADPLKYLFMQ